MDSARLEPLGKPLLTALGLGYRYRSGGGVEGVDLELQPGVILGVLGANGSGKSTLLRLLGGLLSPQQGELLLDGEPLAKVPLRQRARRLGFLSQAPQFEPTATVLESVLLGRHPHLDGVMFESETDTEIAQEALAQLDLAALLHRPVGTLSGGERQRVALARLLAQETELLLLDEPTTALDVEHQVALVELLRDLGAKGRAVVVVLHDLLRAVEVCTELLLLAQGRIVAHGPVEEALAPDALERTFGLPLRIEPSREYPGSWLLIGGEPTKRPSKPKTCL